MKLKIAALALAITTSAIAQDKAFEKGKLTIDASVGLVIYKTKTHTEENQKYWTLSGLQTKRVVKDTTDGAGAVIYPINVAYGVTDWISVGGRMAFSKYITSKDTVTNTKPTANGFDIGAVCNIHAVRTKKFDLPLSITFGYSHFSYFENDVNKYQAKGGGINFGMMLIPRLYFTEKFGMFMNIGYLATSYPNLKIGDKTGSNINDKDGRDLLFKLKGSGTTFGLGFIYKI